MATYYELLPIYDRHIIYGDDLKAIKKKLFQFYPSDKIKTEILDRDDHINGLTGIILSKKDDGRILCFIMFVDPDADHGVVAHEATHLVNYIFDYLGQEPDALNDEAQAYLTGYFVKQFCKHIRKEGYTDLRLKPNQQSRNFKG
jgi:hypothetical protein